MSDRALQDLVLRALADGPFRASREWQQRALADPVLVERFARFLARHFYHERIVHFFKYSRALARVTDRRPEAVLRSPAFDALLPTMVLGGRDTARAVAGLVAGHVVQGAAAARVPYLEELLRYESAMMIAEAGPRVWRDDEPPKRDDDGAPETVEGTALLELAYDLPAILPQLLAPWAGVPEAAARPTTLLIARSPHGRVTVARTDSVVARVVELADGRRTPEELARATGVGPGELEAALAGLSELGAVRFATGS